MERVAGEFDRVAGGYDRLTGLNPGYRRNLRKSAERMRLPPAPRLLDLCCGTGLSTEALAVTYPDARELVALDASEGMLARARRKELGRPVRWVLGDAMDPAAAGVDAPFDGVLMAYGLRNVPDPDTCLSRILALLAPGGRLAVHEYTLSGHPASRAVWNAVTLGVVVPGGLLLSGSTRIYRYLRRSVLEFDTVEQLRARMRRAGFEDVRSAPMGGWQRGIVHTVLGTRPR